MRIYEVITESSDLNEGPKWDAFKQGVGNVAQGAGQVAGDIVGGVAQGVGGLAGGAVGAVDRMKQGFSGGRAMLNKKYNNPYEFMPDAPRANGQQGQQQAAAQQGGQQGQQQGGAPAQGQDPAQLRAQGKALIKQADDLEKQQKQQGQQQQQQQQQRQQQNNQPAGGQQTAPAGGAPVGSQSNAEGGANAAPQANPAPEEQPAPNAQGQEQPAPNAQGQEQPAPDAQAQAKPAPERQSGTTASSSGGMTQTNPTGQVHTANANNPNMANNQAQNVTPQPQAIGNAPAAETPPAQQNMSKADKKAAKNLYKNAQTAADKSGFQRGAEDNIALNKAKQAGMNVSQSAPKINAYGKQYEGFQSRFLGMMI